MTPKRFWTRLSHFLPLVLALIPLLVLVFFAFKYKVDVPCFEDWLMVPMIEKFYQKGFPLADAWAVVHDQRFTVPFALLILLIRASHWDMTCLVITNLVLASGILAALFYQIRETLRLMGDFTSYWWIPLLSLFVFSLHQSINWLWTVVTSVFINMFVVIVGIVVLSQPVFQWRNFFIAVFLNLLGSYSRTNGLLAWPLGLLILPFLSFKEKGAKWLSLALWALIGIGVIFSYFYDYQREPTLPSAWVFATQPLTYFRYVLTFLGATVINFSLWGAFGAGTVGLVLFIMNPIWLVHRRK